MRRRSETVVERDESKRYLESYADLMSLLLVFFILLFAFGQEDLARFRLLSSSLRAAFSGVTVFSGGMGIGDGFDASGMSEPGTNLVNFSALPTRTQDFMRFNTTLTEYANTTGIAEQIAVNVGEEGIYISLSSALLFPSGSVELTDPGRMTLATLSRLLNELPNHIRVEAHTDDTATLSVIYPTNWELSAARAVSVVRYMQDAGNVDPRRLSAVGMAEFRPLYPNDTPEYRALNRRADILILYPPEEEAPIIDLQLGRTITGP